MTLHAQQVGIAEQQFEANKNLGECFSTLHDAGLQLEEFRRNLRDYSEWAKA
jgi:hypothetical protein